MTEATSSNLENSSLDSKEKLPPGIEPGVLLVPNIDKDQVSPEKTRGIAVPAFIKKRDKVLFVTGIHREIGLPFLIKTASLLTLRKHGFDPEVYKMYWKDKNSYLEKEEALKENINKNKVKFLAGISAGGTASLLLHAQGMVDRIVTLAGWCQPQNPDNSQYLEPLVKMSLSFGQAVEKLSVLPEPLTQEQLKGILNFWSKADIVVPKGTSTIPGSQHIEVPGSHRVAIANSLLLRASEIAKHFEG